MSVLKKVKLGVIGLGNMGSGHLSYIKNMENVDLVGVCDIIREKADKFAYEYNTVAFYNHKDLLAYSGLEAILIAVPHYDHTPISIDAFNKGVHVLCEKPLAVHVNDAKKSIAAYEIAKRNNPELVFSIMLMERTYPVYKKIKEILDSKELGSLTRVTWINTAWFRSQAYYESSEWRATWAGEGGGILTNQCPHNIDMYQWLFGMPSNISGHANIGKYHDIEVEDEVTAYFEHENGMIGHFIVSTSETPGTNRLEIVGENGKLLYENGKLIYYKNKISMFKFSKETQETFGNVESHCSEVPLDEMDYGPHQKITENFLEVILNIDKPLIAHGNEGINSVEIANAIMLSSFNKKMVSLPIAADEYEEKLKELIANSK